MSTIRVSTRFVEPCENFTDAPVRNRLITSMVNPWSDIERDRLLNSLEVPYFNHFKLEVWDAAEQAFAIVESGYF